MGIRRVMDHTVAVDHIERIVGERQMLGVVVHEFPFESAQGEVLFRVFEVAGRQIDVGHPGAMAGELTEVGAKTAADLQHRLTAVPAKFHHLEHPRRIFAVPVLLHFQVPLEGTPWSHLGVVASDGVVVPLVLDFLFVRVSCRHPLELRHACSNQLGRGQEDRFRLMLDLRHHRRGIDPHHGRRALTSHEPPDVGDVALPGIVSEHRLPGIASERGRRVWTLDQRHDGFHEFVHVARRAEHGALVGHREAGP